MYDISFVNKASDTIISTHTPKFNVCRASRPKVAYSQIQVFRPLGWRPCRSPFLPVPLFSQSIQARVREKPCVYYYLNPTQKRTSRRFVLPVAFTPEPSIIDFVWAPTQLRGKDVRLIFPFEWLRECFKFYRSEFLEERISHELFFCRFQIPLFRDLPRAIQPFTDCSGCADAWKLKTMAPFPWVGKSNYHLWIFSSQILRQTSVSASCLWSW